MKKGLNLATKGLIYFMGIAVFSVCAILVPEIAREETVGKINPPITIPYLIGAWVLSLPIFYALLQTLKLLNLVDQNKAFSDQTVKTLQKIKVSAIIFSSLVILGAIAAKDVTPIVIIGSIFTFSSIVISTFIAVLQRILKDAIEVKSENDLIV